MKIIGLLLSGAAITYITALIFLGHNHAHVPEAMLTLLIIVDILLLLIFNACMNKGNGKTGTKEK